MMKNLFLNILIISTLVFSSGVLKAQKSQTYLSPEVEMNIARELFQMQQYAAAKEASLKIYNGSSEVFRLQREEALYYAAISSTLLFHKDADLLCRQFADFYRESIYLSDVYLHWAHYKFTNGSYRSALNLYELVDENSLDENERITYLFKKGYCYFSESRYSDAKPLFAEVKETDCQYKNKALFYYSHILYLEQNARSALAGFQKLRDVDGYSAIVPFYIAQLHLMLEDYDAIIAESDLLLAKSTEKRVPEINHIIAQAYYKTGRYTDAIPYLETYFANIEMAACEDYYALGYCYYQAKEYEKAVDYLTKAICRNRDELSQQSYFIIGDSYLKMGKKEAAANIFYAAYELKKDSYLTEDALFTYAQLQYELSSNPFSNAISALEKYMNEYPKAIRRSEAERYLSDIYLTTKNYNAAISSLEKINHKSAALNEAYQRVLCYKGMELYNAGKYKEAQNYFSKSMNQNFNPKVYAQALYWYAESYYRQGKYPEAVVDYNRYFASSGAPLTDEYNQAYYNAGYAHFKSRQYSHALNHFLTCEKNGGAKDNKQLEADLYNRIGDCYFMLSELSSAQQYYEKTINLAAADVDYAIYQRAQTLGNMNKYKEKIDMMSQLRQKYPQSDYAANALLETADTYLAMGENEKAAEVYRDYIKKYPKNSDTRGVMLKLGMVYFNAEDDANAMKVFKQIVEDYPRTKEASTALKNIENLYSISGNVEEFFSYVRNVSFANITAEAQDTITYNSAADKYFNKQFAEAENGFDAYIKKFPEGIFSTHAHFYRAECLMRRSHLNEALSDYEYVIAHPSDQFEIVSMVNAADIHLKNKNYKTAIDYYRRLQSKDLLPSYRQNTALGLMRAYYADSNFNNAINMANVLLDMDKLSNDLMEEAKIVKIRSAIYLKNWSLAQSECMSLQQSQTENASEALYHLAEIEYLKGNLDAAEKKVFEVLVNIAYEYWSVKSYILLGDIYADKGNTFQAKHTYLSIVDNYDGEELRMIALNKYNAVLAIEDEQQKALQQLQEELQNKNDNIELGN